MPQTDQLPDAEATSPAMSEGLFADIVFDRPMDQAFTYAVPPELRPEIGVGRRVEAPFGRGDRAASGYCIRVHERKPDYATKEILAVLDSESLVTESLLRLTRWMADYYLCSWGQVLHAVVPAGAREQSGIRETIVLEAVPEAELPAEIEPLSPKQTAALTQLRLSHGPIEMRQLARQAGCGTGPIGALVQKGYARRSTQKVDRFAMPAAKPDQPATPIVLNADQEQAWKPIEAAVKAGGFQSFLLHGVTGSGKTEIYLRAIEEVIRQGKEAIVLVPEISLTPQTIARFRGRCGEVAVLHSHFGDAERGGHWRRVAAGQVQVVVGARSAVFAPDPESRPHRHRRGARKLIQTGIDAALSRPRRGGDAGPPGKHPDRAGLGDAVAGELAECPARTIHALEPAESGAGSARCRRSP